jgi:dethiobiotin synthase
VPKARILFVTGTDTGVGKTLLTSLLLHHLRQKCCHALALKPFCSGSRKDVSLLRSLQDQELASREINPFYFSEPVAPLVAARKHHRPIRIASVLEHIQNIASRCETLLIEGAGGLLVPIANHFTILDLIARLHCRVVVVARNKLGTINHTLLTVRALQHRHAFASSKIPHASLRNLRSTFLRVVMMSHSSRDSSSDSNPRLIREFLAPVPLFTLPFLGHNCRSISAIKENQKKFHKTLARILE